MPGKPSRLCVSKDASNAFSITASDAHLKLLASTVGCKDDALELIAAFVLFHLEKFVMKATLVDPLVDCAFPSEDAGSIHLTKRRSWRNGMSTDETSGRAYTHESTMGQSRQRRTSRFSISMDETSGRVSTHESTLGHPRERRTPRLSIRALPSDHGARRAKPVRESTSAPVDLCEEWWVPRSSMRGPPSDCRVAKGVKESASAPIDLCQVVAARPKIRGNSNRWEPRQNGSRRPMSRRRTPRSSTKAPLSGNRRAKGVKHSSSETTNRCQGEAIPQERRHSSPGTC